MYYKANKNIYPRMLIEVNVTKPIPQQITVIDPNGRTFMEEVMWSGSLYIVINVRRLDMYVKWRMV